MPELLRWEASTDGQPKRCAQSRGWRLEVEQDMDGDWTWRASRWDGDRLYEVHEVVGTERTQGEAEDSAAAWAESYRKARR